MDPRPEEVNIAVNEEATSRESALLNNISEEEAV